MKVGDINQGVQGIQKITQEEVEMTIDQGEIVEEIEREEMITGDPRQNIDQDIVTTEIEEETMMTFQEAIKLEIRGGKECLS